MAKLKEGGQWLTLRISFEESDQSTTLQFDPKLSVSSCFLKVLDDNQMKIVDPEVVRSQFTLFLSPLPGSTQYRPMNMRKKLKYYNLKSMVPSLFFYS